MTQAFNLSQFANKLNSSGATDNTGLQNSAVTVTAGTGLSGGGSVALGSSVTLTNAGVTSFNGSTGAVTYSSGVTSIDGQTGAVVTSNIGSVGGIMLAWYVPTSPYPSNTIGSAWYASTAYAPNTTVAGSDLRYGFTYNVSGPYGASSVIYSVFSISANTQGGTVSGRTAVTWAYGGTALTGSWRTLTGVGVASQGGSSPKSGSTTGATWYSGLWVRYA